MRFRATSSRSRTAGTAGRPEDLHLARAQDLELEEGAGDRDQGVPEGGGSQTEVPETRRRRLPGLRSRAARSPDAGPVVLTASIRVAMAPMPMRLTSRLVSSGVTVTSRSVPSVRLATRYLAARLEGAAELLLRAKGGRLSDHSHQAVPSSSPARAEGPGPDHESNP